MFSLIARSTLFCLIVLPVPVVPINACTELMNKDWSPKDDLTIPDGYSLADILMIKGEVVETIITNRQVSRYFLTFMVRDGASSSIPATDQSNRTEEITTMRTMLLGSTAWKFVVKYPSGSRTLFKTAGVVQDKTFLLQMSCVERNSVCHVTSLGNSTVGAFSYNQPGMSQLLKSNKIKVNSKVAELVNLTSISMCRASQASVEVEVSPAAGPESVVQGDSYSLSCLVRGLPVLAATWIKDGVELRRTRRQIIQSGQEEQTLILTYIVMNMSYSDEGSYVCRGRSLLVGEGWESRAVFLSLSGEKQNCTSHDSNDLYLTLSIVFGTFSAVLLFLLIVLLLKRTHAKKKTPTITMSTINGECERGGEKVDDKDDLYTENTVSFEFDATYDNHELYSVERSDVVQAVNTDIGENTDIGDNPECHFYVENTVDLNQR